MRATNAPLLNVHATDEYCSRLILQIKIPESVAHQFEAILKVTQFPKSALFDVRNPKQTDFPGEMPKLFSTV
jgi:hypothetical protein